MLICCVLDSTYHLENFNNTLKDAKVIWHLGWSATFLKNMEQTFSSLLVEDFLLDLNNVFAIMN